MGHISEQTLHAIDKEIMRLVDMGDMNKEVLECLYKLADIKKDTLEAMNMEESNKLMDQRSSMSGNYYDGGSYGPMYRNNIGNNGSYGNGSYRTNNGQMNNGYSRTSEREQIMERIGQQMEMAQTEQEREMIRRIMNVV